MRGGKDARADPDHDGDDQRGEGELDGRGQGLRHVLHDRVMGAQGHAEVTMDDAGQKVAVLHHDRLIEVQLAAHAGDVRRRDALPGQGAGGVARNHVHADEGDQADAQEQRDQEQNAPCDVGCHWSIVSRRGGQS